MRRQTIQKQHITAICIDVYTNADNKASVLGAPAIFTLQSELGAGENAIQIIAEVQTPDTIDFFFR